MKRLKRETESSRVAELPVPSTSKMGRRLLWGGLALLALVAIGWTFRDRLLPQPELFKQVEISQVTRSGRVGTAALSPDGKYVVYSKSETGSSKDGLTLRSVWVKQVGGGEVQIVAPAAATYNAFTFSPDGNNITFSEPSRVIQTMRFSTSYLRSGEPFDALRSRWIPLSLCPRTADS